MGWGQGKKMAMGNNKQQQPPAEGQKESSFIKQGRRGVWSPPAPGLVARADGLMAPFKLSPPEWKHWAMSSAVVLGNDKALVVFVPISTLWGRCGEMEGGSVGQFICVMSSVNYKALLFAVQQPSLSFCKVSGNNTTQVSVSALRLLQILDLPAVVLDVLSVLGLADTEGAVSTTMVSLRSLLYLSVDLMKGRRTQPWDKTITSPRNIWP